MHTHMVSLITLVSLSEALDVLHTDAEVTISPFCICMELVPDYGMYAFVQLNLFQAHFAIIMTCVCKVQPKDGSWDMRSHKFWSGVGISDWAVTVYVPERLMPRHQVW